MRYVWISRLACICSLLIAGKAQASIYDYFYTGNDMPLSEGYTVSFEREIVPGYQGVMRIDERLIPGNTLVNATVTFVRGFTFDQNSGNWIPAPWPPGLLQFTIFPFPGIADESVITFSTDRNRRIVSWFGEYLDGWPDGEISSVRGDDWFVGYLDYSTPVPGTWSDPIRVYDTPPSIPLPLGGVLLLTALGGLAVHRLRRSA